jgi:hypothetical protein
MDSIAPVALEPTPTEGKPGALRSKAVRLVVLALPLLFGASRAMASLFVTDDVRVVVQRSDAVVFGKVERVDATWKDGRILSDALVRVSSAYKGRTPAEIHVLVPGGVVAGIRMRVTGEPEPRAGDESVLFLTQHDAGTGAHFHVVDGVEGSVAVARDAQGQATVVWTEPETKRSRTTSLSDFTDYVHRTALEQAK